MLLSFYFIKAPTHRGSDAGHSDVPRRSHNVLPFIEKEKVDNLMREKKLYAEADKNKPFTHEIAQKILL